MKCVLSVVAALSCLAVEAPQTQPYPNPQSATAPDRVARFDVAEFAVVLDAKSLEAVNPYTACTLDLEIRRPGDTDGSAGETIVRAAGFYAGDGRYLARWLADGPQGRYTYRLRLSRQGAGKPAVFEGEFRIAGESSAASRGPLRVSRRNPIWFADRDGEPVFLSGAWSHSSLDIASITGQGFGPWYDTDPAIFNRYYDHAVEKGYIDADRRPTPKYFAALDGLLDDLARHRLNLVCVTADHMGWGFQSASNWHGKRAGEFTEPLRYDPSAGRVWDHFLAGAMRRGIYVKINLQEWCQGKYAQHPFNTIEGVNLGKGWEQPDDMLENATARDAWQRWVRYLVSRYGAFNNVHFQMGNEPPGDGYTLGQEKWKAFDRWTMETVKQTAGRSILYCSGAPVGCKPLDQGDYDCLHPTHTGLGGVSSFIFERRRPVPCLIEEIKAYVGKNKAEWVPACRYMKFGAFAQGAYASTLVMWSWKHHDDALDQYYASTVALRRFVDPVADDLFELRPDDSFIAAAPAEIAKGIRSPRHAIVYMQKDDGNTEAGPPATKDLRLSLPDGEVTVHWFDPIAGRYLEPARRTVSGGVLSLRPPEAYVDDFAVRVTYEPDQSQISTPGKALRSSAIASSPRSVCSRSTALSEGMSDSCDR